MLAYTGTEEQINIALAQINSNCGLPFGQTQTWDVPKQDYQQSFWFIWMPTPEGWTCEDGTHFTQEQMINGVINVSAQESDDSWFPPYP